MIVGILEVALTFYAFSLKDKRGIVRRIIQRTKTAFNAAVAEVDELDAASARSLARRGRRRVFAEQPAYRLPGLLMESC